MGSAVSDEKLTRRGIRILTEAESGIEPSSGHRSVTVRISLAMCHAAIGSMATLACRSGCGDLVSTRGPIQCVRAEVGET